MTRIHDVTRPLGPGCVVYPGDIVPEFYAEDNGQYRITGIRMSSHSGTHIDAPAHYLDEGATIDEIPIAALMGLCQVIDCTRAGHEITANELRESLEGTERVLLKTAFSGKSEFDECYPALSLDAAHLLASERIVCIGTDAPSIEGYGCNGEVHRALLSQGIVVIELLDLAEVPAGMYWMIALPLRLQGADGAPCRVLLAEESGDFPGS